MALWTNTHSLIDVLFNFGRVKIPTRPLDTATSKFGFKGEDVGRACVESVSLFPIISIHYRTVPPQFQPIAPAFSFLALGMLLCKHVVAAA